MNSFYENFERNVTGLSTDVVKTIRTQVDELLESFPKIKPREINVELECRYKNASSDKIVGPLISELEGKGGFSKIANEITDVNHSLGKYKGFFMTIRETYSTTNPERTSYAKIRVMFNRNSPASSVMEFFESMGVKLSFSLEITSQSFCDEILSTVLGNDDKEPLKRVKQRVSFLDSTTDFSFDITQVVQTNTMRKDIEVEVDYTVPFYKFVGREIEPVGGVKSFISFCEEKARTMVYRTRSLIPNSILEEAIMKINKGLGVDNPRNWRIEKQIPQVRNFQIQDMLKENYKGYATTPKADGYRYFMVFLKNTILYVRPPNIYKVVYEGKDIPQSWIGFVFDGELIEKEHWKEENLDNKFIDGVDNYYCIFDVLGFPSEETFPSNQRNGVLQRINCLKSFFEEVRRNSKLGNLFWSNNYNSIYLQPPSSTRIKTPIMKTFFEIKPYDDSTETSWYSSDAFFDTLRPKLRYVDDGLIFTPVNATYPQLSAQENMSLKWKPIEMLSIDFRYKTGGDLYVWRSKDLGSISGEPNMKENDDETPVEEKEVPFRGTPFFPLFREQIVIVNPDNIRLANEGIYEFIYDVNRKVFRVTRPRFDKSMPNTIKDAAQIWTDYKRPVTENLIRGIGRDGLVETSREVMWSWVEHFLSKANGPIFDFTDFQPSMELPIRFLENNTFRSLTKDTQVFRVNQPFDFDFPRAGRMPSDPKTLPEIDILIINGQQLMLLEGRVEGVTIGNDKVIDESYIQLLKLIVSKSTRVFVRNLSTIIPRELPTLFHPDTSSYGNEEELRVTRINDETVDIEFRYGGVFYDVTTGSYDSIVRSRAHLRNFEIGQYVSAGHRIKNEGLEDNGPERILSGKHFGKLYDYLYNVVLPRSYFQPYLQSLFSREEITDTPLEDIIKRAVPQVSDPEKPKETVIEKEPPKEEDKFVFEKAFDTEEVDEVDLKEFFQGVELKRETFRSPEIGDLFDMISKSLMVLEMEASPETLYANDLVSKRTNELRLILGGLIKNDEELVKAVYERLGLGLVFLRRIKNSVLIESYFSRFFKPETYHSPKYGFLLVESRPESKDLFSRCSLLGYRGKFILHHSDPLLSLLHKNKLTEIDLIEEKLKISPANSGKVKVGSTSWNSLHRLFNSLRFIYPAAPDNNREYVQEVLKETTDNKADYLIDMEVPIRFRKQTWGVVLLEKIARYEDRGVRPDPLFEDRAENEFGKLLEGFTEKNRRELLSTGDAFLYDPTYPNNLYGKGLMYFRNSIRS